MRKWLLSILLLSGTALATEAKMEDWYVIEHGIFTPALNTNSSALAIYQEDGIAHLMLLGDFDECLQYGTENKISKKSLLFNNNYVVAGKIECRGVGEKTDSWYPLTYSDYLIVNALLEGNSYISVGTVVYSAKGYIEAKNILTK